MDIANIANEPDRHIPCRTSSDMSTFSAEKNYLLPAACLLEMLFNFITLLGTSDLGCTDKERPCWTIGDC